MLAIYTIGHSTRTGEEFVSMLRGYGIELLADIRTIPRSRRNPQFGSETLRCSLGESGIEYAHLPALGGLRHPQKDSINTAWRNESFRGYADYMQSEKFAQAVENLMERASRQKTALMCAEAVPWRCHRSLVSDALAARGVEVIEIMSATSSRPHRLTPWAVLEGTRVTYPGLEQSAGD